MAASPVFPAGELNDVEILDRINERFAELEASVSPVPVLEARISELDRLVKALITQRGSETFEINVDEHFPHVRLAEAGINISEHDEHDSALKFPTISGKEFESEVSKLSRRRSSFDPPKMDTITEKVLDTQTKEYYRFGESTWDLFLFIGTGALGPLGSCQTFVLAVVNVIMQIVFVGIAWYNFLEPEVDERSILDALRWRRSSGHALSEYDAQSQTSLAERVCSLDKSLHISGLQVSLLDNIRKYVKPDAVGFEAVFTGQMLCLVALVCWYLMVAKEINHALALHRGIMALPRGPTKIISRENPFTLVTHYRFLSIPYRRKVISSFLLAYRLFAACLLIYVGTFFLVYTVNVTELILNAVALGIILDIDDLLFDALATTPGRHLVNCMDPLPMKSFPRFRGADVKSLISSCLIPGGTFMVFFLMLAPMVTTLTEVSQAMCGGNMNFVWTADKRNVILMAPTSGTVTGDISDGIRTQAFVEAEKTLDSTFGGAIYSVWLPDVRDLSDSAILSLEETVDFFNPQCADIGDQEPMLNYLREVLGNESITGCADARPYCNSVTRMPGFGHDGGRGYTARMLCPDTCECWDPAGQLSNVEGCPVGPGRPCWRKAEFQEILAARTCVEPEAEELRQEPAWASWVASIQAFGQLPGELRGKNEALQLAQAMWDHGCAFGDNLTAMDVAWGSCFGWSEHFDWDFKTVEHFCPETCGCDISRAGNSACPRPLGRTCEQLNRCVLHNETYFCTGDYEAIIDDAKVEVLDVDQYLQYQEQVMEAMVRLLVQVGGNGLEPWMIRVQLDNQGRRLSGPRSLQAVDADWEYIMILAQPEMSKFAIAAAIENLEDAEATALYHSILAELGVPSPETIILGFSFPGKKDGDDDDDDDDDEE